MDNRNAAIMSLVLVLAVVAMPLCADNPCAATSGDIGLTLPGSGAEPVSVTVSNGGTEMFGYVCTTHYPITS